MSKIIVEVEGGLVHNAFLLQNELFPGPVDGVLVMDFDTDGADGDEVTETRDKHGALIEALMHEESINKLGTGSDYEQLANAYLEPSRVARTKLKNLPLLMGRLQSEEGRRAAAERMKNEVPDKEHTYL